MDTDQIHWASKAKEGTGTEKNISTVQETYRMRGTAHGYANPQI